MPKTHKITAPRITKLQSRLLKEGALLKYLKKDMLDIEPTRKEIAILKTWYVPPRRPLPKFPDLPKGWEKYADKIPELTDEEVAERVKYIKNNIITPKNLQKWGVIKIFPKIAKNIPDEVEKFKTKLKEKVDRGQHTSVYVKQIFLRDIRSVIRTYCQDEMRRRLREIVGLQTSFYMASVNSTIMSTRFHKFLDYRKSVDPDFKIATDEEVNAIRNYARTKIRRKMQPNIERNMRRRMPFIMSRLVGPYVRAYLHVYAGSKWPKEEPKSDPIKLAPVKTRELAPGNDRESRISIPSKGVSIPYVDFK
jgi:hypothetical protein